MRIVKKYSTLVAALALQCLLAHEASGQVKSFKMAPIQRTTLVAPDSRATEASQSEANGLAQKEAESEREDARLDHIVSSITKTSSDMSAHALWIEIFILVLVGFFGGGGVFFQLRADRKLERDRQIIDGRLESLRVETERLKADIKVDVEAWKHESRDLLERQVAAQVKEVVESFLSARFEEVFRVNYEKRIFQQVSDLTLEILMQSPEARGLFLSRLRRFVHHFQSALEVGVGKEVGDRIVGDLAGIIQDWHTLGQLFNSDRNQLQAGLLALNANPFPEAAGRIKRLKMRHSQDAEVFALIVNADRTIEDLRLRLGETARNG